MHDIYASFDCGAQLDELNRDLDVISKWTNHWQIFNPDPQKQAQEVIFSKKNIKAPHPSDVSNVLVMQSSETFRCLFKSKIKHYSPY